MKDFIKWLGVNEKVAKVVVWLLIIMIFLITTNTMLESIGFPHYAITYDNLVKINVHIIIEYLVNWLIIVLSFYSVVLLVFRIKHAKSIFKYAILYLILNILLSLVLSDAVMQIFILIYTAAFCYYFSGKNKKYIAYSVLASIGTALLQGIWYMSKARFINYNQLNNTTKILLSLDYFIIMTIIILVKEIYLKKRGEKNARARNMLVLDRRIQERKQICKKNRKKSSKRS